jgi:catechol O-methyltransferase
MEDDPFAVFGDDVLIETSVVVAEENTENSVRDPSCGVLVFHEGTEASLLYFVQNGLEKRSPDKDPTDQVINLIDEFCYRRHWMMHVGPEKGKVLENHLAQCLDAHLLKNRAKPFLVLEVGTYCGYSSIRMCRTILSKLMDANKCFHVMSVDVNPHSQIIAKQLVALAGLEAYVTFGLLTDLESNRDELSQSIWAQVDVFSTEYGSSGLDFVFLDHDKDMYISDIVQLERAKLIRAGSFVAADNILFFRLDDYQRHMQKLAAKGFVETRLDMGKLEYVLKEQEYETTVDLRDGMGTKNRKVWVSDPLQFLMFLSVSQRAELTQYLQDP